MKMKGVVIYSDNPVEGKKNNEGLSTILIENIPVNVGNIETQGIEFNRNSENSFNVLVRKRAFSCNYRDKCIILSLKTLFENKVASKNDTIMYSFIGSDFVGEVINKGNNVKNFQIGDRVIPNSNYPLSSKRTDVQPGIPTNYASQEYEIFHEEKLLMIPDQMPDEVAASFTIGAQTTYSMIRKIKPKKNLNVLVTSAKSNTSLMVISALTKRKVNIFALSSTRKFEQELKKMGVIELFTTNESAGHPSSANQLKHNAKAIGGFDVVIDPFSDRHIGKVIDLMKSDSKYVTCGIVNQLFHHGSKKGAEMDLQAILAKIIIKNISILGNCLGTTSDLNKAIDDYSTGNFSIKIDSIFTGSKVADFFNRTYNDPNRFGKVVFKYFL